MVRILLTGATGYTGGELLYSLHQSGLINLQIVCLVRDEDKAKQVKAAYPDVEIVLGDLKDFGVMGKQTEAADIVLNFASAGSALCAQAISRGLQKRWRKLRKPQYWIQISGASVYAEDDIAAGMYGYASDPTYDDIKDSSQIFEIMKSNPKRELEKIVLSQDPSMIKTALIVSPLIYGVGKGPVSQRSVQAPGYAKATLELGHGFILNDGENSWTNIHVQDVASIGIVLLKAAINDQEGIWNEDGVYNIENGEVTFKDLAIAIDKEAKAQGLIEEKAEIETIDTARAGSMIAHQMDASFLWGTNVRMTSSRAEQQLGWSPSGPSLQSEIPGMVRIESMALKGGQ